MDDQIERDDHSPRESPLETVARLVLSGGAIGRVTHQKTKIIAEFESIAKNVALYVETVAPSLMALAQIDWVAATQRLDELPKKSKDAMHRALAEGWFFGWHDGLQSLMRLVESLATTPATTVDDVMVAYYRTNLEPFTNELINEYPNRAAAIKAAVDAHTSIPNGGYFLSIPVFIAQADGLLAEITGLESPLAHAAKAFRDKYSDDPEMLDLLYPVLELKASGFMMSAKAREDSAQASGQSFTALNRHQVMHGERSDYGTEVNSLKAFSFLVFAGLHIPAVLNRDGARGSGRNP
jgi:hypothetical protein